MIYSVTINTGHYSPPITLQTLGTILYVLSEWDRYAQRNPFLVIEQITHSQILANNSCVLFFFYAAVIISTLTQSIIYEGKWIRREKVIQQSVSFYNNIAILARRLFSCFFFFFGTDRVLFCSWQTFSHSGFMIKS